MIYTTVKSKNTIIFQEIYSDATLVCNDKFYPVHQFVLSTCSEYFKDIFYKSHQKNCKHPFIVIGALQEGLVELLLSYMYKGEINVPQEYLPTLLNAAEILKIKGLAVQDDEKSDESEGERRRSSRSTSPLPKKKIRSSLDQQDASASFTSPENTRPSSTESIDAHKLLLASPPSLTVIFKETHI